MKYRVFFLFLRFDFFVSRIEDTVCIFHVNCENIDDVLVTDMSANNIRATPFTHKVVWPLVSLKCNSKKQKEANVLYLGVSLIKNDCHINLINIFHYSLDLRQ